MLNHIKGGLFFLWIVLVPFQDSTLQAGALRIAGASLSVIPLAALALLCLVEVLAAGRTSRHAIGRAAFGVCYASLITGVYLEIYQAQYPPLFLALKAAKYGLLLALFLLPVVLVPQANPQVVRCATFVAFWIAVGGVLLGDVLHWQAIQLYFHFTRNLNLRPRGLAVESTVLGVQVATLGLLAAYLTRNLAARATYLATMLVVIMYSGSKGAGAAVILALAAVALLAPAGGAGAAVNWKRLARLAVPLLLVVGAGGSLAANFSHSTYQYASVTTRVTTMVAAIETSMSNPFGMGLAGMLPALNTYLPRAMSLVQRLHILVNFSEVAAYVNNRSGLDVDTKSFLFDQLIIFGIPFLVVFWRFHARLFRLLLPNREHYWLMAGVVFSAIALVTYYPALSYYNVPLVYGVAVAAARRVEDSRGRA